MGLPQFKKCLGTPNALRELIFNLLEKSLLLHFRRLKNCCFLLFCSIRSESIEIVLMFKKIYILR